MTPGPFTKEGFWKKLEQMGEGEVRLALAQKRFGEVNHKRALAEEWLSSRDRLKSTASTRETKTITRIDTRLKMIATITAMISVMLAIISIFLRPEWWGLQ